MDLVACFGGAEACAMGDVCVLQTILQEALVAFLSVLELVRMSEIALVQSETFGEIMARTVSPAPRDLGVDAAR